MRCQGGAFVSHQFIEDDVNFSHSISLDVASSSDVVNIPAWSRVLETAVEAWINQEVGCSCVCEGVEVLLGVFSHLPRFECVSCEGVGIEEFVFSILFDVDLRHVVGEGLVDSLAVGSPLLDLSSAERPCDLLVDSCPSCDWNPKVDELSHPLMKVGEATRLLVEVLLGECEVRVFVDACTSQ